MSSQKFRILSIDGGGIRGAFSAHILTCISERLKINLHEAFDMFAGTSTGSIIAAAIACNKSPTEISNLYQIHGKDIFSSKKKSIWPEKFKLGMHSKYNKDNLEKLLTDQFGDTQLKDVDKPLLIPATDIGNGCVHVFKSPYSEAFTRDGDFLVSGAVLASCSAPVYFDPEKVENYHLADGGIWANNPSLAAAIDATKRLNIEWNDIQILSIGTGLSRVAYGTQKKRNWGLLNGWNSSEFVDFNLSLQAQSTHNYLSLILGKNQIMRLNFESDKPLPMDDFRIVDDLVSRADRLFTHESEKLIEFFA
ncbi:CBASS cGAMP-activated phospholipase [Gammaproteobacteria bacterium]|nr:CBASS cGAMP-activated phospholipase [Gammaproteobacteria bacterium]